MSSDLGYRETHLLGLAHEGGTPLLKRLALVVNDARGSHTVNMVREMGRQIDRFFVSS